MWRLKRGLCANNIQLFCPQKRQVVYRITPDLFTLIWRSKVYCFLDWNHMIWNWQQNHQNHTSDILDNSSLQSSPPPPRKFNLKCQLPIRLDWKIKTALCLGLEAIFIVFFCIDDVPSGTSVYLLHINFSIIHSTSKQGTKPQVFMDTQL